jgi:hypothetical protein
MLADQFSEPGNGVAARNARVCSDRMALSLDIRPRGWRDRALLALKVDANDGTAITSNNAAAAPRNTAFRQKPLRFIISARSFLDILANKNPHSVIAGTGLSPYFLPATRRSWPLGFRLVALRPRFSPGLLFLAATIILHYFARINFYFLLVWIYLILTGRMP